MDLDLAMFRGFDAHGIMQDHSAGCDLERDGYGEPRVFTLRKVLSLLKRICDEVESDYEDAKVATAQIVSMETNDRYKRFCKIYNRLEEEKELINDVGLNPYSHAKKWILDANGVTDYVTSVAQDMRKAAKKHGTESAIFRNVGLKHLPELPSFDKEFYAKDAEFRNLVKELKEAFLTYRGNAVESSIILDDNIWEIARLSLHDAFTFFVDECDIDLTYAPVVCYLVIRKYGTVISKKRIKSTQISLFAIFDRYHMARSNKKVARQDFRLYANLRAAFSHFYGAALPGAVKMLWDDAFLSCSTYLDQQYDFLKSVINEEFGADSELFASIRQIHACVDCNTCVNLSHSANPKIQKLIKRFSCIEGQESWEVSKKKIRKLLCADGIERYKNTLDSYCGLISRPHTTQEIVDFLNEITNPDDSAKKAQELFVNLSLNAIFPELHIPNDNTVNLLCGALINSATEYVIRLELAERCETKLYSWFTAYLNLKSDE